MRRQIPFASFLALLGALLLVVSFGPGQRVVRADDDDHGIDGTWDISIPGTPFRILRTITDSGVVDAYAFPPITFTPGPLVNSAGHGVWKHIGDRTYSVTVKYFQLNPANNASFNVLDSIGTVRETVHLSKDGKHYTSEFETDINLPNGTLLLQNKGTTTATRMEVEPLQ
jgi:hypothetical protein